MRIAVIVAHPDDEVLGCGATIARLSAGHEIRVVLPLRRCDARGREHWDELLAAFARSAELLGAEPVVADDLLDETMAETHVHLLHEIVVPSIEWADAVVTHWPGDVNQVHRGVARAVEIATRPFRRRRHVYCVEIPTSTDQAMLATFAPSMYSLVERSHAERKCEAMALYPSESAAGRRPEDLMRRLQVRGAEAGSDYAEAFVVARQFF